MTGVVLNVVFFFFDGVVVVDWRGIVWLLSEAACHDVCDHAVGAVVPAEGDGRLAGKCESWVVVEADGDALAEELMYRDG